MLFDTIFYTFTNAIFVFCRIGPIFYLLPFLSSGNISAVIKMPVFLFLSLAITPEFSISFANISLMYLFLIVLKELFIGLMLGCLLSMPFWVFHAIGSFIDNQRGATLSSTLDPTSGIDTSELAKFFNLFAVIIYLENNGMLHLVKTISFSYDLISVASVTFPNVLLFTTFITNLMINTIQVSSPVIIVMLGGEVFLGVLSRYASQLNAFAVSLTIKSGLAFFILILYFYPTFIERVIKLTPSLELITEYFNI